MNTLTTMKDFTLDKWRESTTFKIAVIVIAVMTWAFIKSYLDPAIQPIAIEDYGTGIGIALGIWQVREWREKHFKQGADE